MLFFKVEGTITNQAAYDDDSRQARRERTREISNRSDAFNQKFCKDSFYFIYAVEDGVLNMGVICNRSEDLDPTLANYLKYINYELKDVIINEITISETEHLLNNAFHDDYIPDNDEIMERFGIDKVTGRFSRRLEYDEKIINESTKESIYSSAQKLLLNKKLLPELKRIYSGTATDKPYGHPVHYIIQTDDISTRKETLTVLMQALYDNKRLHSKRYCLLNFEADEDFYSILYDKLYAICDGCTVVVNYQANNETEDGEFASSERDIIEKLCEMAKRYRNKVLTILCLPRECKATKALFYENLGSMSFVEFQEDFVNDSKATDFLKMLAKENHIRADKHLFAKVEAGKGYLAPDLPRLFDEWYDFKLKTSIYPQYKKITAIGKKTLKEAPKGNAYDELQEMIGLSEAKAVIQKALNYYKIQKLYTDKGFKWDTPAMHMIFSGNPGTAKTTVARLFTRIMKDNGLISKGQLIEVGRGDLVGKYVGWTAKTVQEKFKDASGGVLFIDEAYSLVDDRDSSFGDEAINTIVQEMENHRHDVVVIFAGYPDKMEGFLQKNPGLRSRIAFHVPFADYSAAELCQIATLLGKGKNITFDEEAMVKLKAAFEAARKQGDFGNGRYVRNLLEQARMNQATRLLEYDFDAITAAEIATIKAVDIIIPEVPKIVKRSIGFAS